MNIFADSIVSKIRRVHLSERRLPYCLFALSLLLVSCWSSTISQVPTMGEPVRAAKVVSGSKFILSTFNLSQQQREDAILKEALSGNIPVRSRTLIPLQLSAISRSGKSLTGILYVTADYFAIGSDDDNIRTPMNPMTAQKIANSMNMSLPTTKIVDLIYRQAKIKLPPRPIPAGPKMTSSQYYRDHDAIIDRQLAGKSTDVLIAGQKKDVVLSNKLDKTRGKVAIYGWHRLNGKAIQPLSTVHYDLYADYSHGIRLVHNYMIVNGKKVHFANVLADPELSILISNEGPIRSYQIKMPQNNNTAALAH